MPRARSSFTTVCSELTPHPITIRCWPGWVSIGEEKTTTDLIEVALKLDGTYYLPYQLFYSQEQLHRAYPEIDEFFAAKKKYDPIGLFTNKFYEKYGR